MSISLVVPIMNEQDNIEPLISKVAQALKKVRYELILVDDGSTDNTVAMIKQHMDKATKLICLNRNYGQSLAMAAGLSASCYDYVVTLDGDLQNDPEDILPMIEKLESEPVDVVAGYRQHRQDKGFRKVPSWCANRLIVYLTGVNIRDYGCTLKVFRKDVAKNLCLYGELHRFIPVMAKLYGANITEVPVRHHSRKHGDSKYASGITSGIGSRAFAVLSDLCLLTFLLKFALKPIHLFAGLGMMNLMLAVVLVVTALLTPMVVGFSWLGYALVVALFGIQWILLGLLAEVMMRTYYESQGKTPYVIKSIHTKME